MIEPRFKFVLSSNFQMTFKQNQLQRDATSKKDGERPADAGMILGIVTDSDNVKVLG